MKIIILAFFLFIVSQCDQMPFPPPPYPDPDKTTYGELDVKYEWKCFQNDYVVVIFYYHSSGEWRKIEERAPGICIH